MEHKFISNSSTCIVETTKGRVRGYRYDDISIFKGIPYAKAKRFHAPEPVDAFEGVFDATSYGYVCPLLDIGKPNGELLVPHRYWPMNEDCQNLNIWTPECDDEKRPVLVWLHGGGYSAGSSIEQVAYEGENMCRLGQVVVVSINHRLNILGYFDLSAYGEEYANSGNAGMDDIIASLKWIKENIQKFGGDPENVTLFGQSGGGTKITTLLQMPAADGLYAKGINMSGIIGPVLADSKGSSEELIHDIMSELSISDIHELETVPFDVLASAYKKVSPALKAEGEYTGCTPYPNAFYKGTPEEYGFRAETSQIPMLIGTVFGEFTSFSPTGYDKHSLTDAEALSKIEAVLGNEATAELIPLFREAYPERRIIDLLNLDFLFRLPTLEYVTLRSALNDSTYVYLFNQDMPVDGGRTPWHCSDIPYVFHNTELVPITQEAGVTKKLEKQIFESVLAFARSGNPNCDAVPHWPASTPDKSQTMIFDKATRLKCNHDARLIPLFAKYMGPVFERKLKQERENVQH